MPAHKKHPDDRLSHQFALVMTERFYAELLRFSTEHGMTVAQMIRHTTREKMLRAASRKISLK